MLTRMTLLANSLRRRLSRRQLAGSAAVLFRPCRYQSTINTPTRIFSGIQPTGIPQIGNYLGALRNWIDLQSNPSQSECDNNNNNNNSSKHSGNGQPPSDIFYCIVDLHALTIPRPPDELQRGIRDMARVLLACGVDPRKSHLFVQSEIPEHSELAWILGCQTPMGWLNRMTQWKGKLAQQQMTSKETKEHGETATGLQLGLFAYPVLQAADILLYNATHVPVGADQLQHLELTRDIAERWNHSLGRDLFVLPQAITPKYNSRVMSLRHPTKKMSKSDTNTRSRILLTDTPDTVADCIRRATTDAIPGISYDPETRPGISNLLSIWAGITNRPIDAVVNEARGWSTSQLKEAVTEACISLLRPIQAELARLERDNAYVESTLNDGREMARQVASKQIQEIRNAMGLRSANA
ncbi:tryptophanyl-tRNA synthetase [Syncephalis plumigaleata]|nr:tryptophanyl-tRNA synthetase [Syncephalis plumigaleata]